jgi:hypothetical protein
MTADNMDSRVRGNDEPATITAFVIPAKAGIHFWTQRVTMDSRVRGDDDTPLALRRRADDRSG